jgi:hypothetical protein
MGQGGVVAIDDKQGLEEAFRSRQAGLLQMLERELHDLCQPVTSLQCRLELGKICGGEEALVEAVDGALEDAARIFTAVAKVRGRLVTELGPPQAAETAGVTGGFDGGR